MKNRGVTILNGSSSLGFQKVVTMEQLSEHHPLLDMVDHSRKPTLPVSPADIKLRHICANSFGLVRIETSFYLVNSAIFLKKKKRTVISKLNCTAHAHYRFFFQSYVCSFHHCFVCLFVSVISTTESPPDTR